MDPHTGREAKTSQSATWGGYDMTTNAIREFDWEGPGFVFSAGGGLAGVDLDDCIIDGTLHAHAVAVVNQLDSYTERSPSGSGLKIFLAGSKPLHAKCSKANVFGCSRVECYDKSRFFTVTGDHWEGTPTKVEQRENEITAFCNQLWPLPTTGTVSKFCIPSRGVARQIVGADERCRRYVERLPDAISGQGGSGVTFRAACTCFRFGLSDDAALLVMSWFNQEKCKPAWTDAEILHKLKDAKDRVEADGEFGSMIRPSREQSTVKHHWHNELPIWIRDMKKPKLKPFQRAILQAIADRCDAKPIDVHGSIANGIIGYQGLADVTGMSLRSAFGHVKSLLSMGLLVMTERGRINWKTGEVKANVYAIPGIFGAEIKSVGRYANPANRHTPLLASLVGKPCIPSEETK